MTCRARRRTSGDGRRRAGQRQSVAMLAWITSNAPVFNNGRVSEQCAREIGGCSAASGGSRSVHYARLAIRQQSSGDRHACHKQNHGGVGPAIFSHRAESALARAGASRQPYKAGNGEAEAMGDTAISPDGAWRSCRFTKYDRKEQGRRRPVARATKPGKARQLTSAPAAMRRRVEPGRELIAFVSSAADDKQGRAVRIAVTAAKRGA